MRLRWYIVSIAPSTPPRSEGDRTRVHGFLDQVGERVERERACQGLRLVSRALVDDQLDRHGAAHDSSVGVVIASS